jgi:hypothetical protein
LTYYSETNVSDADTWKAITTQGEIGYVKETYSTINEFGYGEQSLARHEISIPEFSPKFRIVIGGEIPQGGIYRIG